MPNRIIKESICTSDRIASLSDFEFRLWVGLITTVDDAGRGDARPAVLKGRIFPLRERITVKDVDAALASLAAKGCVSLYENDGKPYFWFPTWSKHQRIRDCKPKYPAPDDIGSHSAASCRNTPQVAAIIQSESNPNTNPKDAREQVAQRGFSKELEKAVLSWLDYKAERKEKYKATGFKSMLTEIENNAKKHGSDKVAALITQCMAAGYKGIIFDKLNQPQSKYGGKKLQEYSERSYTEEELKARIHDPLKGIVIDENDDFDY